MLPERYTPERREMKKCEGRDSGGCGVTQPLKTPNLAGLPAVEPALPSGLRSPSPYPQLLGDLLPLQVAVLGCDGLQLANFLPTPLLLVDARVFPVLPKLLDFLCTAAAFKLHTQRPGLRGPSL